MLQVFWLFLSFWTGVVLSGQFETEIGQTCDRGGCYPATGNLLIGREHKLSATSTCGLVTPERYCIVSHLEEAKKCFNCDSRHEYVAHVEKYERSHRIENVVTRRFEMRKKKWWQSENGLANVTIRFDLEAEFHFTHLVMTFKTFRPRAMLIERSADFGKTWKIYRYFAYDCAESFPGIPQGPPQKHTDIWCDQRYANVAPSSGGEVVFKVLSPHLPLKDPYSKEIQDLLRITNLRINFTQLHTLGDNLLDNRPEIAEKYYYAIYDMVVRGSCSCYGHASRCIPIEDQGVGFVGGDADMVHGRCECTHHTTGLNCETCEPFFNDLPWRPAIGKERNECKRCNCNGHATRCHFDPALFQASGYSSGGRCDDCMHNTMGPNCEQCQPYYYKDPKLDINDPNVCKQCACDAKGSENRGICESETNEERGLVAGRCRCKANVNGTNCERCKDGFWNLREEDPKGCEECVCYLLGTIGNEGCDKKTGDCNCKRLVTGERCDQCLPEHWGLSEDQDGCKRCDCDPGGAIDNHCDVVSGQCKCRSHYSGRRCEQPDSGYYCASLTHYTYEAELGKLNQPASIQLRERGVSGTGVVRLQPEGSVDINVTDIAVAREYAIVLKYETQGAGSWEDVKVNLLRPGSPGSSGPCHNKTPMDDMQAVQVPPGQPYFELPKTICLEPGLNYVIQIFYQPTRPNPGASFMADAIILFPPARALFPEGSNAATEFEQYQCRQLALADRVLDSWPEPCQRLYCAAGANLIQTALQCDCDATGSVSGICSIQGGQCECRPLVVGRRCDRCSPATFGFGPQGCTACECNSVGSLDNFCDVNTGQCKCREGVYGRRCDQCQPGSWGFPSCRPCECNGHAELCDQKTGACIDCRDLSSGHACERCLDGYYGDPRLGADIPCRPCPCPGGPGSGYQHADTCYLGADRQTVICNCRVGYISERCDKCEINYWGNPREVGGTCERCDCSGNIDFNAPESCDPADGRCLKCLHHTTGRRCEHCEDGFYGDATRQQCQKCICNVLGTDRNSTRPCDRVTGQCPCLPNVIGGQCDQCAENHWKLASGTGCEQCACDEMGVIDGPNGEGVMSCNEFDGQCHCRPDRGGRKCEYCRDYYYGDPQVECHRCECNQVGSLTLQCHRVTGQCECQPQFGGRNCDECARGFTGQFPDCRPCGECFHNWDKIIQDLANETRYWVGLAGNLEEAGVSSVYDKDFKAIEGKLADVRKKLDTANVTNADMEKLKKRIDDVKEQLENAMTKVHGSDKAVTESVASVDSANASLLALKEKADGLKADAEELKQNTTKLREGDIDGAYHLTLESAEKSKQAEEKALRTEGSITESEKARRQAKKLLEDYADVLKRQYAENQDKLNVLNEDTQLLYTRVPGLNEQVCGAKTKDCDDLCGGAGCEKCGGPSCSKGAVTRAKQAKELAEQANKQLKDKQEKANQLLQSIRKAVEATANAVREAERSYREALRAADRANATRQRLVALKEKLQDYIAGEKATPAEIRTMATEVLNMTISLKPEEIQTLAEKISGTLGKLKNIDEILSDTRRNLTRARELKERADQASLRAETVLKTVSGVQEALKTAKTAQDAAEGAIKSAKEDIQHATEDIDKITDASGKARNATDGAATELQKLEQNIEDARLLFLQIKNDVEKAGEIATEADQIRAGAEKKHEEVNKKLEEAEDLLKSKQGGDQTPKERAEQLRKQATTILQKSKGHLEAIEADKKRLDSLELSAKEKLGTLDRLNAKLDASNAAIQERIRYYETCERPPT